MSDATNVYKPTTSAIKMKSKSPLIAKLFSALTFLSVIFGGTIVGFSFKTVRENQVGYYVNEPGYFSKGTYFQLPWATDDMNIVDVGLGFLDFKKLMGSDSVGREFYIETMNVMYNVTDIDRYVTVLKTSRAKKYCENEIEIAVLAKLSDQIDRAVISNISVPSCGITVLGLSFSTPTFGNLQKTDTSYNISSAEEHEPIIVPVNVVLENATTTEANVETTTNALPDVVIKNLNITVSVNETEMIEEKR